MDNPTDSTAISIIPEKQVSVNPTGKPPTIKSPAEMQQLIDSWEKSVFDEKSQTFIGHPTVTGLARYCGFMNRTSMYQYAEKPDYQHIVKRGIAIAEEFHEKFMCTQGVNPIGHIFCLKNMGWSDNSTVTNRNLNVNVDAKIQDLATLLDDTADQW